VLGDQELPDTARRVALLARSIAIGHQPLVDYSAIRAKLRRRLSTGARFAGSTGDTSACLTARRCTPWRSASASSTALRDRDRV
jgi:hypothetical protein